MKTLYDLLEALPDDDADGLRTAFRRAVKGAHPDLRPGDPDAALKFRQIVHASEILGDAEQRAAYDDLLEAARLEHESASAHPVAARIHKLASGVIALTGASAVTVGGYLLFMHMSAASLASPNNLDVAMRASREIAIVSPADASPAISGGTTLAAKAVVPSAVMSSARDDGIPAANAGRAPGSSYRNRNPDLNTRMADLDQAFRLDARFLPAYVDRDMIFYHTRKFNRVFPDTAWPEPIEKPGRSRSAPAIARRPRVDQVALAPPLAPLSQRRTAAQDPSRGEGFAAAMLR